MDYKWAKVIDAINEASKEGIGMEVEHEDGEKIEGQVYKAELRDSLIIIKLN